MPHRRHTSTSSAIIAAVFAVQAVADTVTLTQFQQIKGFPEACTQAYETPIEGCTTNDFLSHVCSRACVAGLEKETTLLNKECLGISTSSSTLIGAFFEGRGVQAVCARIETSTSTSAVAAPTSSSTSPAAAATSSSQSENTSSSSSSSSSTSSSTSSATAAASTSTTLETSSSSTSPASASDSSSSSSTTSSSATAQATTFSGSTTISQTTINIPLTNTATAANTAGTAFGGDVGNLNGPPSKGSSLRANSIFMSVAAGLALGFLIWS